MANRLEKEKPPYLLQHKENPVDWYPWGEEAFQRAKQEDMALSPRNSWITGRILL